MLYLQCFHDVELIMWPARWKDCINTSAILSGVLCLLALMLFELNCYWAQRSSQVCVCVCLCVCLFMTLFFFLSTRSSKQILAWPVYFWNSISLAYMIYIYIPCNPCNYGECKYSIGWFLLNFMVNVGIYRYAMHGWYGYKFPFKGVYFPSLQPNIRTKSLEVSQFQVAVVTEGGCVPCIQIPLTRKKGLRAAGAVNFVP